MAGELKKSEKLPSEEKYQQSSSTSQPFSLFVLPRKISNPSLRSNSLLQQASHTQSQQLNSDSKGSLSNSNLRKQQFIVFPKIQASIREKRLNQRSETLLELASHQQTPLKQLSNERMKLIHSEAYVRYQNAKRIRGISTEQLRQEHVCKKSQNIPQQIGSYAMPGLVHNEKRSGKLSSMSFTKMQLNQTNYSINFTPLRAKPIRLDMDFRNKISKEDNHNSLNTNNVSNINDHDNSINNFSSDDKNNYASSPSDVRKKFQFITQNGDK